jgi:hypothetical protein
LALRGLISNSGSGRKGLENANFSQQTLHDSGCDYDRRSLIIPIWTSAMPGRNDKGSIFGDDTEFVFKIPESQ